MDQFHISGGSVPGTEHIRPGQPRWTNNQDAFIWRKESDFIIGIVCDGCGGTPYSEIGARLGCRFALHALTRHFRNGGTLGEDSIEPMLLRLKDDMRSAIKNTAELMGNAEELASIVSAHFLFTMILVVMDESDTVIISFGDGVYAINDDVTVIEPYEGNAPPYLAYTLVEHELDPALISFVVRARVSTGDVQSLLIGSDGVADLIDSAASTIRGKDTELVGPLSQFWEQEYYTRNPDAIRRRLAVLNREGVEDGRIKHGLLPDDTTLITIRRHAEGS